jgi:hypothetical protein
MGKRNSPRRLPSVRIDDGCWYWSFRRGPLRRDEAGDVRWDNDRSLSLNVLPFNIWSPWLLLLLWLFFLFVDFAVCHSPSYDENKNNIKIVTWRSNFYLKLSCFYSSDCFLHILITFMKDKSYYFWINIFTRFLNLDKFHEKIIKKKRVS